MNSEAILKKCAELQVSKRKDYTTGRQFENFERSALLAEWFRDPLDKAFVVLIGTKLARLAALLDREDKPNHESIEDTFVDLTNYCALWGGRKIKDVPDKIRTAFFHEIMNMLDNTVGGYITVIESEELKKKIESKILGA